MRAVERVAVRAGVPLRYSQGFNPRPKVKLLCPRPVGVASRGDPIVLELENPPDGEELLRRLNAAAPTGMSFARARPVARLPLPARADYELPLDADRGPAVRRRIDELARQPSWPVERIVTSGPRAPRRTRTIDLRPLVEVLEVFGEALRMRLVVHEQMWARPAEVLRLLNLNEQTDLAATVRTRVGSGDEEPAGPSQPSQ